jgi:hypothetical protein
MGKTTVLQSFLEKIVGSGEGNGIALIYLSIGLIGFIGCCIFRMNKNMKLLDEV